MQIKKRLDLQNKNIRPSLGNTLRCYFGNFMSNRATLLETLAGVTNPLPSLLSVTVSLIPAETSHIYPSLGAPYYPLPSQLRVFSNVALQSSVVQSLINESLCVAHCLQ